MARIRQLLAELPQVPQDQLLAPPGSGQEVLAGGGAAHASADGTPVYTCEQVEQLRGSYREPEIRAWPPQLRRQALLFA